MVKKGKLLTGTWRKRQFVGFLVLKMILGRNVAMALTEGVSNWDIMILKWASIVFQSSLDCRAGEVAKSDGYTGNEFLKWSDIEVRFDCSGNQEFENIVARVCIRWEKGTK